MSRTACSRQHPPIGLSLASWFHSQMSRGWLCFHALLGRFNDPLPKATRENEINDLEQIIHGFQSQMFVARRQKQLVTTISICLTYRLSFPATSFILPGYPVPCPNLNLSAVQRCFAGEKIQFTRGNGKRSVDRKSPGGRIRR